MPEVRFVKKRELDCQILKFRNFYFLLKMPNTMNPCARGKFVKEREYDRL